LSISPIDLTVIVVYMLGIMAIGILSVRKKKLTGDMYFLAGRSLGWPVVGAALFASNISTIHLVGLAQDGYAKGLVVGNFEWMATFLLIVLALVFAPFYMRSVISTLPEFLEKRYSPLARSIMAFMAILAALLIHIGISLYAGSKVFETFFGIDVWLSIIIISTVTAIYTVVGGLRAVVVTETIQTVILLGGAVLITGLAIAELPKHGVDSWADLNMTIDVQHSAEALDETQTLLTGADWLVNDTEALTGLQNDLTSVGQALQQANELRQQGQTTAADGQLEAAHDQFASMHTRLASNGRLPAFQALMAMQGAAAINQPFAQASAAVDPAASDMAKSAQPEVRTALQNTGGDPFTAAASTLGEVAKEPKKTAVDLAWHILPGIKTGEKLDFVAEVLDRTDHGQVADVLANEKRWDRIATVAPALANAVDDVQAQRQVVIDTGDMNEYLQTDEPVRTPRLSMLRAEGPFSWLAVMLGYPILGIWYWCSDQTIVQRVLGARNETNAQNGALFGGLLKITPAFLMVLPGTIAYVIFRDRIGDDAGNTLPIMIEQLMPVGLMGLMAAALLAALMSTIAAALNSAGTLVAKDIVGHFRPQTSDAAQVRIGRIAAIVVMLLAMAWSTQGGKFGTIFEIINKIPALFLAPPITTVFLWGVFWKRGTKEAAVATLILGLTLGFVLFVIDSGLIGGTAWISSARYGLGIPFMLQATCMFCIWSVMYVLISLATPKPAPEQVENTTWRNPLAVLFEAEFKGWYDPRLLTVGLFAMMVVLYYVFR
jgi:Na+/proline symporter